MRAILLATVLWLLPLYALAQGIQEISINEHEIAVVEVEASVDAKVDIRARRSLFDIVMVYELLPVKVAPPPAPAPAPAVSNNIPASAEGDEYLVRRRFAFTGPPGRYLVEVLSMNGGLKRTDRIVTISPVNPAPPGPRPPGPGPKPPGPTPDGFKGKVHAAFHSLSDEAKGMKTKITQGDGHVVEMPVREAISGNYQEIADEAEANPNAWGPATMVNELKTRNAGIGLAASKAWKDFWPKVGQAFKDLGLDSNDTAGHVKAFREVSEVLSAD